MNAKFKSALKLSILILSSFPSPNSAHAEINFHDIKGVHDLIKPEFEYLSPLYGGTLIGTKTLENMRFYGNYGPKKEGYGCLESASRIHELLSKNNDCPQDKTSELIQRLFPSPDGANFVANQIDSDLASHLDPKTLGKLIAKMAQARDSDLADPKLAEELENALIDILLQNLNTGGYYEQQLNAPGARLKKIKKQNKQSKELAAILLGALKDSRLPTNVMHRNFPEQVLLAYFWKVANHKEDFLPLLKGMADCLKDPTFLDSPNQVKALLADKVSIDYFRSTDLRGDSKRLAEDLVAHPERLVLLASQDKLVAKPFPPILHYSQAKHSSIGQSNYPDCGETSIRNFFNIALYDPIEGKFNPGFLDEFKESTPSLHFHPGLRSYYSTHTDPAASTSQIARDDWSESVVSGHGGIDYLKPSSVPQCEINSGVDNIMNLMDRLLYQGNKGGGPISQATTRASKIDALCKSLSRKGFKMDWELEGSRNKDQLNERNTGVTLRFIINDLPSFAWVFNSGHFSLMPIRDGSESQMDDSWIERIAPDVLNLFFPHDNQGTWSQSPLLLHWFINERNWPRLVLGSFYPEFSQELKTQLFYSRQLNTNHAKLWSVQLIVEGSLTALYPAARKLRDKVPKNDLDAQRRMETSLAFKGYPWGDPTPTLETPFVKYTRVPKDSKLLLKLGVSHEKSFETAWIDPRGLIWAGSHLVGVGEYNQNKVSWQSAKDRCLALNQSSRTRRKVKAFYESIESNQDLAVLRMRYLDHRNTANFDHLIKKYTELKKKETHGCFAPTFEDLALYSHDQGSPGEDDQFIPRYLGHHGSYFWSGSSIQKYSFEAIVFDSLDGKLYNGIPNSENYAQCVCTESSRLSSLKARIKKIGKADSLNR